MREIRFRGWDVEWNKWVYGYYESISVGIGHPREYIHVFNDWGLSSARKIAPDSVGQYIGEKDKNGKEVYEGDILMLGDDRGIVKYEYTEFICMSIEPNIKGNISTWCNLIGQDAEIIGNIFENKDLLP